MDGRALWSIFCKEMRFVFTYISRIFSEEAGKEWSALLYHHITSVTVSKFQRLFSDDIQVISTISDWQWEM